MSYFVENCETEEENRKRYGTRYEPGEQKKRHYNLPVDPKTYRFGDKSNASSESVFSCMHSYEAELDNNTQLTDKQIEVVRMRRIQPPFTSSTNQ